MADIQRGMFLPHPGENPTASSDIGTTVLHMLRRALNDFRKVAGVSTGLPSSVMRLSAIIRSISRRLATPARASSLAIRSPSGRSSDFLGLVGISRPYQNLTPAKAAIASEGASVGRSQGLLHDCIEARDAAFERA